MRRCILDEGKRLDGRKPDDKPADDDPDTAKNRLNASDASPTGQSEASSEQELTAEQMTLFSLEAWQEALMRAI